MPGYLPPSPRGQGIGTQEEGLEFGAGELAIGDRKGVVIEFRGECSEDRFQSETSTKAMVVHVVPDDGEKVDESLGCFLKDDGFFPAPGRSSEIFETTPFETRIVGEDLSLIHI